MRNPIRRNRNIGTSKQGHGQDNRLDIPQSWHSPHVAQQTLGNFQRTERPIDGRQLVFFVEENSGGCLHACTVSDVCEIFRVIPVADWDGLNTIVFRQPTQKQRTLNSVWGRLYYDAVIGHRTGKALAKGPVIIIEAQPEDAVLVWPTSLDPDSAEELKRLDQDGHQIERRGRKYIIQSSLESTRNTQLYRTLIHELGHWVDYLEKVERPAAAGEKSYHSLADAYFSRPSREREAYAHRYADELGRKLRHFGLIPFNRIQDAVLTD